MVADLLTTVVDEAVDDYAAVEALSRRAQARAAAGDLDGAMEDLDLALQRGGDALRLAKLKTELADQAGRMDVVVSALEAWAIELRSARLERRCCSAWRSLSCAEREEEGIPHRRLRLRWVTRRCVSAPSRRSIRSSPGKSRLARPRRALGEACLRA